MKLYTFNNLVERESSEISIIWKFSVIALCLSAILGGMISCIAQGNILNEFSNHCVLYSTLVFEDPKNLLEVNDTTAVFPPLPHISLWESRWGPMSSCETCQFTSVMSVIMGAIWITMFAMCPRGGRTHSGLPEPWRIVYPAILFFTAIGVACIVTALQLQTGFGIFCQQFTPVLNETFGGATAPSTSVYNLMFNDTSCGDPRINLFVPSERDKPTMDHPTHTHFYIHLSLTGSWVSAASWMVALAIQLVRLFISLDFQLVTTTVTKKASPIKNYTSEEVGDGDCKEKLMTADNAEDPSHSDTPV